MHQLGLLDQAEAIYKEVLRSQPRNFDALQLLATIATQRGNFALAVELFDKALDAAPGHAPTYNNRGVALENLKRPEEALESYDRALRIQPDYAEAHNNRGNVLGDLRRFEQALVSYDQALRAKPDYAQAHLNRGNVLSDLKRFDEALASYDRALRITPEYAEAHYNRGNALAGLKRLDEALEGYDRALGIKPDYAEAHYNRGRAMANLKRLDEAIDSYHRALSVRSDYADAHWNLSLLRLLTGDFARGWEGYEWGWKNNARGSKKIPLEHEWDGTDLAGSLLVLPEQGIGDQIFYSGMLNELRSHAQSTTVCVDVRLVNLYQRSFDGMKVVSADALNTDTTFDAQVYMGSLGRFFRQSISAFDNVKVPYLFACRERARGLESQIRNEQRLVCGLSWVSKNLDIGVNKSISLEDLAPVLELARIDFVDLQYGDTSEEQAQLFDTRGLKLKHVAEIDNFNDIDGLAALIDACDIVVTVSNTTAHLAAALGKPVLVMLPFSPGLLWYWHVDREDSVWYRGVKLFRQASMGDWDGVIQRVRAELARWSEQ